MPGASRIAADLSCGGCGRRLIINGKLKCLRCRQEVRATLGQKKIFCLRCQDPRMLLAKDDQALCPKKDCRAKIPMIPKEEEMANIINVTFDRIIICDVSFKELVEFQLEQVKSNQGVKDREILPISYILRERIIEELEKILKLDFDPKKMAESWDKKVGMNTINRADDPSGYVHTYLPDYENETHINVSIYPWQRKLVVVGFGGDRKSVSKFELRNLRSITYDGGSIDFAGGEGVYPTQRIKIAANGETRTIL